jgi:hypothetical protein
MRERFSRAIANFDPASVPLVVQALRLPQEIAGGTHRSVMHLPLVTGIAKGNRVVQILSATNCKFLLGPNSRQV